MSDDEKRTEDEAEVEGHRLTRLGNEEPTTDEASSDEVEAHVMGKLAAKRL